MKLFDCTLRDGANVVGNGFSAELTVSMVKDAGLSGCHSALLKLFHQVAQEENVPLYQLIVKVSEIDRKAPAEALLRQVAATLK